MTADLPDTDPRVVAFCCRHCAYAAADLAGSSRIAYPSSLRIVELPCTGRVDVLTVLRSFEDGADGVLIAGCLEGKCHYLEGNLHAKQRVERIRKILGDVGLGGERVRMVNISAAMGAQFAEIASEMVERVAALGASPLRDAPDQDSRNRGSAAAGSAPGKELEGGS